MKITIEQLNKIVPFGEKRIPAYIVWINKTFEEFGIDTPLKAAAFIAQIAHESASFRYTTELASGSAYDRRTDLGNTRPEAIRIAADHNSTPGRWWRGHGLIQVTGYDNHKSCGEFFGIDLLHRPELLAQPEYATRSAGWFWQRHDLNHLAEEEDFQKITKIINGGYNGLQDRLAFYRKAREVLT